MHEPVAPAVKRKLIAMLRRGVITRSEAADFAKVTRQAVDQWCRHAAVNPKRTRAMWARREIERELELNRKPSKRELKQQADEAVESWDQKHGPRPLDEAPKTIASPARAAAGSVSV